MEQKIDVIGIGCDDAGNFSEAARNALTEADIVFASESQMEIVKSHIPSLKAVFKSYPRQISVLEKELPHYHNQKIVMMALGDPLFYGIGAILLRFLPTEQLRFHSAISSLQAALSRFGLPWNDLSVVSLHGRSHTLISSLLKEKGRYGILTDEKNSPLRIAEALVKMGQENAVMRIAESLGRVDEKLSTYRVIELIAGTEEFSPLLVLIVDIA